MDGFGMVRVVGKLTVFEAKVGVACIPKPSVPVSLCHNAVLEVHQRWSVRVSVGSRGKGREGDDGHCCGSALV